MFFFVGGDLAGGDNYSILVGNLKLHILIGCEIVYNSLNTFSAIAYQ